MEARTHLGIDSQLCGTPRELSEGRAVVVLEAGPMMTVDARGLVHGGFVFGLADYAAMLAINHEHVVLGAAEVRFLAPVRVGETLVAVAVEQPRDGKKRRVTVDVSVARSCAEPSASPAETIVFQGAFVCFVPARHVLESKPNEGP